MKKELDLGVILKFLAVISVVGVLSWSGWQIFKAYQQSTALNQELIGSFRVVFQPEKVSEAAEALSSRREKLKNLPLVVEVTDEGNEVEDEG